MTDAGDASGVGTDGRHAAELPAPLGGAGQTIDVWVVAAEVPLAVAREYLPDTKALSTVERIARLYVPLEDQAAFDAATAASVKTRLKAQKETWLPWALVLRLGTAVRVHFKNVMKEAPASLHPHGVKYTIDNDGTLPEDVAWPGGPEIVYEWTADTPGTWPLHDHARTLENVGRGLFSAIVVKTPEEEASLDRDYLVTFHDFDGDWFMGFDADAGRGGGHGGH